MPCRSNSACQTSTTEATGTTSGLRNAIRNEERNGSLRFSSIASPSDSSIFSGTLMAVNVKVLAAARKNTGLPSSSR
ncbi:hypothetical protein D3C76_1735330 [compost metagenome]